MDIQGHILLSSIEVNGMPGACTQTCIGSIGLAIDALNLMFIILTSKNCGPFYLSLYIHMPYLIKYTIQYQFHCMLTIEIIQIFNLQHIYFRWLHIWTFTISKMLLSESVRYVISHNNFWNRPDITFPIVIWSYLILSDLIEDDISSTVYQQSKSAKYVNFHNFVVVCIVWAVSNISGR